MRLMRESNEADISFKAFPFHGQKVDFYAKAGSGEDVDICKYCIIDLVNSIDDRPMQETEL